MSYVDAYRISLLNLGSGRPAYPNPENLFFIYDQGVPGFMKKMLSIISGLNKYPAGHELYAKLSDALKGRKIVIYPIFDSKASYSFGNIFFPTQPSPFYFCCIQNKVFERSDLTIFAHETIHALHEFENIQFTFFRNRTPSRDFSNMEEKKTILGFCDPILLKVGPISICENAFLMQMGFDLRLGHLGYSINHNDPLLAAYMAYRFDLMNTFANRMNTNDLKKSVDRLIHCPEDRELFEFLLHIDSRIDSNFSYLLEALSALPPDDKATYFYWLAEMDFQRCNTEGKTIHLLLLEQVARDEYEGPECRLFLQKEIDDRKVHLDPFLRRASELGIPFRTDWDQFL